MLFKTSSYAKRKPIQVVNASINSSGEWIATLPSSVKGSSAQTYIITAQLLSQSHTSSIVVIKDVIFGDVFVASGQSNMAFLLKKAFNGSELVQDANHYPNIRL